MMLAILGLWWVQIQQKAIQDITASTFVFPHGRWILWSLTLVAVGLCLGLAVAAGSGWHQRLRSSALLWGLVPLAAVTAFNLFIAGVMLPHSLLELLVGVQMQVASAIAVGVFLSGLLVPMLPTQEPPKPEDV